MEEKNVVVPEERQEEDEALASDSSKTIETVWLEPRKMEEGFREKIRNEKNAIKAPLNGEIEAQRVQGVLFSAQQSTSQYHFLAEVLCCFDQYYWFLQKPSGEVSYLGYTEGFGARIGFTLPLSSPSGSYRILLDAYMWDYVNQRQLYFDFESGLANVPILVTTPDVGVIPGASGCGPSSQVYLDMDNEDHNQASNVSGWVGKDYVDGNGNTRFYFCRVSGYSFSSLRNYSSSRTDYAVLQLGSSCPPGSVPFARYFDNEDNQNRNSWFGNVSPNTNIGNTWMNFCLFKGDGGIAAGLPNLGFEYGVFASAGFGFTDAAGNIYTDDEDNNNANSYSVNSAWASAAQAIVSAGGNTNLKTARRATPACFDGRCNGLETASSCRADCGYCGDGTCYGSETVWSCNPDCGYCGDGICGAGEYSTCPGDCSGGGGCLSSSGPDELDPSRLPIPCEPM